MLRSFHTRADAAQTVSVHLDFPASDLRLKIRVRETALAACSYIEDSGEHGFVARFQRWSKEVSCLNIALIVAARRFERTAQLNLTRSCRTVVLASREAVDGEDSIFPVRIEGCAGQ